MIEEKEIIKLGNSIGLTFDKAIKLVTGLKLGDKVDVICSKGKITIKKKGE